jgi:hypothetical protein
MDKVTYIKDGGRLPTPLEAEISSLLLELGEPNQVANELLRRWNHQILTADERSDVANFIVAAGLSSVFFEQIIRLCDNSDVLPWGALAEAIGYAKIKPDLREIEALFEGATEQNALEDLLRSHRLDIWSRKFSETRAELRQKKINLIDSRKQELKEKIRFLRSHRLYEQEAELLEQAQAMHPEETEFRIDRKALELQWARDVIAQSAARSETDAHAAWPREILSSDLAASKLLIVNEALRLAAQDSSLAYDLGLTLHFMEFHAEALQVLEYATSSYAVDWLKLELMIFSRQFANALNEASLLEAKYPTDPEAAFSAAYARARALHGLGERDLAADVLRGIVAVRPLYKSAHSLLMEWSGGDL